MRVVRHVACAAALASAWLVAPGCSSDGASSGESSGDALGGSAEGWEDSEPVSGEVSVTWKNLNPANPPATATLVNESSEYGQLLKSGKRNSSEIRVLSDAQMGGMLTALEKNGFFRFATEGMTLEDLPDVGGKKAVIVVTRDGRTFGLLSLPGTGGTAVPKVFYDSKMLIIGVHSQLPGAEVRASVGAPDENIFTAPPPKFKRP